MRENRKQTYVYGNTVRQESTRNRLQSMPKKQTPVKREQTKTAKTKKTSRTSATNKSSQAARNSRERMSIVSFSIYAIGLIAILIVFFQYIDISTKTLDASRVLTLKEQQLQKLKSENDVKEDSLNSKVDLHHVYEIATTQYGMVHANEEQIIVYKKNESEYIKQNEDIPTN